jgi:SAM-dependent methyltransferase
MFGIYSRFFPSRRTKPNNERWRSTKEIDVDVDHAVDMAHAIIAMVAQYSAGNPYPRVLEIGPGSDFGAQIILAGTGAKVTVADRFLAPWQPGYHPTFYRRLLAKWGAPCPPLEAVIAANDPRCAIALVAEPAEDLRSIADCSFDVVLSTAVLEHVFDLPAAIRELARVTVPGGVNSHQVDFRDHRDFARPLEFLLMADKEFTRLFDRRHGDFGNRWRHCEVAALLRAAGFSIEDMAPNLVAAPEYMASFLPKLRTLRSSRFAGLADIELAILGARFVAVRDRTAFEGNVTAEK